MRYVTLLQSLNWLWFFLNYLNLVEANFAEDR